MGRRKGEGGKARAGREKGGRGRKAAGASGQHDTNRYVASMHANTWAGVARGVPGTGRHSTNALARRSTDR